MISSSVYKSRSPYNPAALSTKKYFFKINGLVSNTIERSRATVRECMRDNYSHSVFKKVLSNNDILSEQSPKWVKESYSEFSSRMEDKSWPCPFAKKTYKKSEQNFIFVNGLDDKSLADLKDQMVAHTNTFKETKKPYFPLLVIFKPQDGVDLEGYHDQSWSVLQFLHDNDPMPWPNDVPKNTDDPLWTFCFNGVQLNFNFSTPKQEERFSRNLGKSLTFLVVPTDNFKPIAGDTEQGKRVRDTIRKHIMLYDGKLSDALGVYGDEDVREWKQYPGAESKSPMPIKSPLVIR